MRRRFAAALAVTLIVAGGIVRYETVRTGPCQWLTPENWILWFLYGCDKDTAGGGGSGAGQP